MQAIGEVIKLAKDFDIKINTKAVLLCQWQLGPETLRDVHPWRLFIPKTI